MLQWVWVQSVICVHPPIPQHPHPSGHHVLSKAQTSSEATTLLKIPQWLLTALRRKNNQKGKARENWKSHLLWGKAGREFGGEWICVYVWLSPFAVHYGSIVNRLCSNIKYKVKENETRENLMIDLFQQKVDALTNKIHESLAYLIKKRRKKI